MKANIWGAALCVAVWAPTAIGATDIAEIKRQRLAEEQVKANLKDPESAQFRNQKGFCGEVNSKNSFGGYGGFQRYIAAGVNMVVFENDRNLEKGAFQQAWSEFCK